jgi:uncharacterized membrane protein YbhN (UPF0104 family)
MQNTIKRYDIFAVLNIELLSLFFLGGIDDTIQTKLKKDETKIKTVITALATWSCGMIVSA